MYCWTAPPATPVDARLKNAASFPRGHQRSAPGDGTKLGQDRSARQSGMVTASKERELDVVQFGVAGYSESARMPEEPALSLAVGAALRGAVTATNQGRL